ncbi:hypothetical protein TIFTF001_054808 [Ficus carica]|uniref:Uncharacterized protein n=1 Tax=Ficus carica TaxID=3494 RepID=A0AA88EMA2_FICCA|nr:hypothetical protein TIFTF001_054808 [Ficus carica]
MQALLGEMRRMMRVELEHIHERLDRVEEGTQQRQPPFAPNAPRRNMCIKEKLTRLVNLKATI